MDKVMHVHMDMSVQVLMDKSTFIHDARLPNVAPKGYGVPCRSYQL